MVFFGMPVGLGLGRDHEPHYGRREGMVLMPYDPLWVGQLAGLRGRTVEPAAGPRGTRCMKGSIPLGGSPRLLSVARALLPKRVFYLEGGGRKPGQWERARARVRQTWGFFMGVYSGEAYGRRVRALQGEGRGFPLTFCLFVGFVVLSGVMNVCTMKWALSSTSLQ